jgi:hypothetical protein
MFALKCAANAAFLICSVWKAEQTDLPSPELSFSGDVGPDPLLAGFAALSWPRQPNMKEGHFLRKLDSLKFGAE